MSSSRNSTACNVQSTSNPDISGIGIRISVYIQNVLAVLLVNRSWEDAPTGLWTFISTNVGLIIAAIVQRAQQTLSLYEAIEVTYLIWWTIFSTELALASYSRQRTKAKGENKHKHNHFVRFGAVFQVYLSIAWTLYIWAAIDSFLGSNNCGAEVQFVFFFESFPVLGSGRRISLAITSVLSLLFFCKTTHETHLWLKKKKRAIDKRKKDEEQGDDDNETEDKEGVDEPLPSATVTTTAIAIATPTTVTVSNTPTRPPDSRHHDQSKDQRYLSCLKQIDGMLIGIVILQVLICVYFITCNELYVRRNHTEESDNSWGFGQILSLIIVLPSVIAVMRAFKKYGLLNVRQNEKSPRRKKKKMIL